MAEKDKQTQAPDSFINPIDGEKIATNPHLLPYAHERGGATIKPVDMGKTIGLAMTAMYEQTDMQLDQIRAQIELLARQANEIKQRMTISERIYEAQMGIDPIIGRTYYLYTRNSGENVLSMISPTEWGPKAPYHYVATIKLLADHTWEMIERREE
ncbi:DUF2452 domain-containing protein [Neolewinella lacunae]|uniref:DUF2452 domain-containing protein n=1 Tax=Neolewinella lacunae TaxID=1517758 RepID=A0A923PQ66_9BACT|nr:DUF2452 domain-containing protein [Neolewinella lacunae]MBC6996530.1 DUF2452 domain-containing protein [Neolewinella lacunae]MDN3634905.1 DUF2452 domain-containing protein [Neolewinella lacunae]